MRDPWTIETRQTPDGLRIVPAGELDLVTAPSLAQTLREAEAGDGAIVLDLGELSFMDSSGLAVVLAAVRRSDANGRRLTVRVPDGRARRLLDLSGAMGHMPLAEE